MCTVNGADIRAVLYALVEAMQSSLSNGQAVRLGELGSLRVSIGSEGKATEKEINSSSIKNAKVIFTPGKDIKKMLDTLEYEKMKCVLFKGKLYIYIEVYSFPFIR